MRLKYLLLTCLIATLPSQASAATIDFLNANSGMSAIHTLRGWAGESTGPWLDGDPTGVDQTFCSYCVDVLGDDQKIQDGVDPNDGLFQDDLSLFQPGVGNSVDVPAGWLAGLDGGDSHLHALRVLRFAFGHRPPVDWSSGEDKDHTTPTPEPATLLLLGTGLVGLAARHRRKSQS